MTVEEAPIRDRDAAMTGGMAHPDADLPRFGGSSRLRADGRPRGAFRDELRTIDDRRNALTVLWVVAAPVAVVAAAARLDSWPGYVAAFVAMGMVLPRMFILSHEAAHRLLFSNRRLNDLVGQGIFGWLPFGAGGNGYRRGHMAHHRDEFGPDEPDFLLYTLYPIPRRSLRRKLRRDATGVSAYRILRIFFRPLRRTTVRFLAGQLLVFGLFLLAGVPWLYLLLWLLPYVTLYQVTNRLRAIAEHGGMKRSPDRRHTTHHVRQRPLARLFVTPFAVGYHLAHHVDSGVPFRNLPRLHEALVADGYWDESLTRSNYPALWKALASA